MYRMSVYRRLSDGEFKELFKEWMDATYTLELPETSVASNRFKVPENYVVFQELFSKYKDSTLYKQLSKADKRLYNKKYILVNCIQKNSEYKHTMYYDRGCRRCFHILLQHGIMRKANQQ
jgi:hypothetical protein